MKLAQLYESTSYVEHAIREVLNRLAEKSTGLPGRSRPLRLTGDLERDLYTLGSIDTEYLDELYVKLNETSLYSGNNEVFRTLHGRFRQIKDSAEHGAARPAAMVERSLVAVEDLMESCAAALDALEQYQLAEFYGGGQTLASFVKDYCLERYAGH